MALADIGTGYLSLTLVLLAAAVVSVPIARRAGLSAIVAYLAAGIIIGPWGLALVRAPETILRVAELGVVLLLFVIGLELQLGRLLAMRRAIFGLGAAQLVLTSAILAALAVASGLVGWRGALVAGLSLALSATSIALQILEERGHLQLPYGQRAFAVLLFQDMAVVPLLALLPLLAPWADSQIVSVPQAVLAVSKIGGAIVVVVLAGRYLLNAFFRLLAATGAREVMTAAALLVVFGTALLMEAVGMSMALGAFLAGVLLAESNFRHELEADIEPFRGLLLALFFMGVGMSIDMSVVYAHLALIFGAAVVITAVKMAIVAVLFRATCPEPGDGWRAGSVLTGAGEFAFVLLPLAGTLGLLAPQQGNLFAAIAAVTMLMGPPVAALIEVALHRLKRRRTADRVADDFEGVQGSVLLIGFGRFGQVVSQYLLAEGIDVIALDNSAQMIQNAGRFGFKVYYGDGTRLDVLRAAGAAQARLIAVCVNDRDATNRIVDLVRTEFAGTKLYVRSYDRPHTLELIGKGVDFEMRETYESAAAFGRSTLEGLGLAALRVQAVDEDLRRRDRERLALQQSEGLLGGVALLHVTPQPLRAPERTGRALNPEAEDIITHETEFSG